MKMEGYAFPSIRAFFICHPLPRGLTHFEIVKFLLSFHLSLYIDDVPAVEQRGLPDEAQNLFMKNSPTTCFCGVVNHDRGGSIVVRFSFR
jgi:hypothetical protein